MIVIDTRLLVDNFDYFEFDGEDRYGQPQYKQAETISNVRIDRNSVFSRDTNDTKILASAVIFVYAEGSTPFKPFKEQSKITFDSKDHVLKKVVYVTNPYDSSAFAYELEVI